MIPFKTLRQIYKIPWMKEHGNAIQLLNKIFYLMIALKRANRNQDFQCLHKIYFLMMDSFILYSRNDAKELVDLLLKIPWFNERKVELYRSMVAFKKLIGCLKNSDSLTSSQQIKLEIQTQTSVFVHAFKLLINFNEKDENRVKELLENPKIMNDALKKICDLSI
jgi:hypothetical protein